MTANIGLTMDQATSILALLFYTLCTITITVCLFRHAVMPVKLVISLAVSALLSHTLSLTEIIGSHGIQNLSIFNVASLISLAIAAVMTLSTAKVKVWYLLPIVYSLAIINVAASHFLPSTQMSYFEERLGLLLHISLAIFAYATLTIALLYSVQITWLSTRLKDKKFDPLDPNIPPLMSVERQLFNVIVVGFLLLTSVLITGYIYLDNMISHKTVISVLAWLVYAVLLWGRFQMGLRGKNKTLLSAIGAGLLTLGYFGGRFISGS